MQPKLALSPMANFLVYVLSVFSGFVKRLLPGTNKTNTSTQNPELPYIKNDAAFAKSFLVSTSVCHPACPDKGGKLVEGSQREPVRRNLFVGD